MNQSTSNLETEVKFHLTDAADIQRRLKSMRAVAHPRRFESNLCFDHPDNRLLRNDQLLRLRQDRISRLTFKQKQPDRNDQCKVYREFEIEVSDHDTTAAILNALGYRPVMRYEKWRRTYTWQDIEFCIDEMPYGPFLEIEGPAEKLRSAADILALPWDERILTNYLAIFEHLRKAHALPFSDLTFDNFRCHPVDILAHLGELQAARE